MAEQVIWWTGALILAAIGSFGASALFAGLVAMTVYLVTKYTLKVWIVGQNLGDVHRYVMAGRPNWRRCEDGVYRMAPTDGPWSSDPEPEPIPHTPA